MGCVSAETASDQKEGGFRDDPFSLHCSGGTPQVAVPRCAPFPTHSAHARSPMEGCWDARVPVKRGSHLGGGGSNAAPTPSDNDSTSRDTWSNNHGMISHEISPCMAYPRNFSMNFLTNMHVWSPRVRERREALQKLARDSHLWSSLWWKF